MGGRRGHLYPGQALDHKTKKRWKRYSAIFVEARLDGIDELLLVDVALNPDVEQAHNLFLDLVFRIAARVRVRRVGLEIALWSSEWRLLVDKWDTLIEQLSELFDELIPLLLARLHDVVGQPEKQQSLVLGCCQLVDPEGVCQAEAQRARGSARDSWLRTFEELTSPYLHTRLVALAMVHDPVGQSWKVGRDPPHQTKQAKRKSVGGGGLGELFLRNRGGHGCKRTLYALL